MTASDRVEHPLVRFALNVRHDDLPDAVASSAKHMLLDTLGCIVAAQATEMRPVVEATCHVFGDDTVAARSYRHARYADCMDWNEGYGGAHFGCGAVAALLALAHVQPVSGKDALAALVAGFETGALISDALGSYTQRPDGRAGFLDVWGIATPVVYAAAATASHVLRLDPDVAMQGFALAGSFSPIPIGGLWSDAVALPNTKYGDAGFCAMTGTVAALMAQSGTTAVPGMFDDAKGLLAIVQAANANPQRLVPESPHRWRILDALYKRWPCCGLMNGPLLLLERLMRENGLQGSHITKIEVSVDETILIPRFLNKHPETFASYQFSLPHVLTMLAFDVPAGALWLSKHHAERPEFVALRQSVEVHANPAGAVRGSARLCIHTAKGKIDGEYIPRDDAPRKPHSRAEFEEKFRSIDSSDRAHELIATVHALETLADIHLLNDYLREAGVHD